MERSLEWLFHMQKTFAGIQKRLSFWLKIKTIDKTAQTQEHSNRCLPPASAVASYSQA
jgi:hypothetical protein